MGLNMDNMLESVKVLVNAFLSLINAYIVVINSL
jgi:hypothetical protein